MKRKFLYTTIILLSSWKSISQIAIPDQDVKIKRSEAIAAVKDLERYDGLKLQYDLLEQKVWQMTKVILSKDSTISDAAASQARLNLVISNYEAMQKTELGRYQAIEKKYKRSVRAGRFKVVLLGGALLYGVIKSF